MLGVMLGLGMFGAVWLAADSVFGGGPTIGIGFGGGGSGVYGGIGIGGGYGGGYHGGGGYGGGYHGGGYHGGGYHGGYYGGSGVNWGVNVPLSSDGSVRLGVGSGGYYSPYYHHGYYNYPRNYYGGYYNSYPAETYEAAPSNETDYAESTPPTSQEPPLPTAGQVGRMSDEQLVGLLRVASEGYARELDDYKNGETWKKYFKLAEIGDILKTKGNSPDAASRTTLAEVLKRLDSSAKNAEYETLTKSWGFKALQIGLREYTLPQKERLAHSLNANLQIMNDSLANVTTGEGWKKHLQIEELGKLAENAGGDDASTGKRLEKILAKFDAVAQDSQYQVVAELNGFAATRADLQRYINALQSEQKVAVPPPPPAIDTAQSF
jgi:hypothetical protein